MSKNVASRALLSGLLGTAVLTSLYACSGGSPAANTPGGAAPGGAPGAPGAQGAQGVPQAAPGLGVNPTSPGAAAPPPTAAQSTTNVGFTDPNNMPFIDPTNEASRASTLFFEGAWTINGGYLEQSQGARKASLSFRQYNGAGLGFDGGAASAKYRADVTAWVYQPSAQYPNMVGAPLGIIGYAPYYRDETHYLLAVAKPKSLEVWAVDGFQPGTEWPITNRLFKRDLATELQVGTPVAWSVEIDTTANSARVWANGEDLGTVTHGLLTNGGHKVSLVSNGNYLHFQDFKLFRL